MVFSCRRKRRYPGEIDAKATNTDIYSNPVYVAFSSEPEVELKITDSTPLKAEIAQADKESDVDDEEENKHTTFFTTNANAVTANGNAKT